MKDAILEAMLNSPALPELLQDGQLALARERKLREKFYQDITPEHKWEFIQGEVIMHSPALERHTRAVMRLYDLVSAHVRVKACGGVYMEKAMTVFPRNDYEPDIVFFGSAKAGLIDPDTLKYPVPDLVVEVLSPSTEARDRGVKFEDYALHGVGEYWIVDAVAETVELYRLQGSSYPPVGPQANGSLSSEIVAGFEIPVRAIFDEELNLTALRGILGGT